MTKVTLIRHFEVVALLGIAIFLAFTELRSPNIMLAAPVLGVAFVLVPSQAKKRVKTEERSERLRLIERLLADGRDLSDAYSRAVDCLDLPDSLNELAAAEHEAENWIEMGKLRLQPYIHFSQIFEAHGGGTFAEELRGRIRRLSEIRSLAETSERLQAGL